MENTFLSRQYLETVSTADLLSLADDYGIDIPDNLNRRFIIGELLEAQEDMRQENNSNRSVNIDHQAPLARVLPSSYNETQISCLLRTPAWAFVYWDLRHSEIDSLSSDGLFKGLFLHVAFYDSADDEKSSDSFDIQVENSDREQYVYIPAGKRYFVVSLACALESGGPKVLANTMRMAIPAEAALVNQMQPGKKLDLPPLVRLSGMEELLRDQYMEHRQSFN